MCEASADSSSSHRPWLPAYPRPGLSPPSTAQSRLSFRCYRDTIDPVKERIILQALTDACKGRDRSLPSQLLGRGNLRLHGPQSGKITEQQRLLELVA